jgi:hypothetical protein
MYHCQLVTISSGRVPLAQNFTGWVMGRGSPTNPPDSRSRSTMAAWACLTVLPVIACQASFSGTSGGGAPTMRPSRPTIERTGRPSSRHHTTSVVSPNVQIMAIPEPLSGSASSWASTGTSTPNNGVRTVVPKRSR